MSIFSRVVGMVSRNAEASASACVSVMSPMNECHGEQKILRRLFEAGLSVYHLRRPYWTAARCAAWIESVPAKWRSRIVLHQHPQLVRKYNLAGFHVGVGTSSNIGGLSGKIFSQCENYHSMLKAGKNSCRIALGPVFPPEKYDVTVPRRTLGEYAAIASYWKKHGGVADVFAFGGVSEENIRKCRDAGFSGVVVVGAVWDAPDPVKAFKKLLRKW